MHQRLMLSLIDTFVPCTCDPPLPFPAAARNFPVQGYACSYKAHDHSCFNVLMLSLTDTFVPVPWDPPLPFPAGPVHVRSAGLCPGQHVRQLDKGNNRKLAQEIAPMTEMMWSADKCAVLASGVRVCDLAAGLTVACCNRQSCGANRRLADKPNTVVCFPGYHAACCPVAQLRGK